MKTCPGQGNYPDDIRQYDDDPRSPFYVPTRIICCSCDHWYDEDDIDQMGVCNTCNNSEENEE